MLLEANHSDTTRSMAPALEPAFPSAGSKTKPEKMKDTGGSFELPVFHGQHPLSMPWSKVTPGEGLTSKSRMYGPPTSMPGVVRCLPERPEPIYPSSYKNTLSSSTSSAAENLHLSPRSHIQKPDFPPNAKRPLLNRPHPQLQLPVPRPEVTPSSMPPTSGGLSAAPSVAAGAGSAFFRGGFPPVSAYPPGGGPSPYMGMPHQRPPPHGPHPGAGPFPGGAVSAAGFMSLAHILFQPKYPLGKKTFQCHECRYITDRKNNLKRHVATMHQDCGKFLECCDVIFRSKAALRDHVLLYHRTGYKCRFCGRNFCRKALLKRHLAVHNGQKEYICEVCDYATSHKSNLERHRKVHGLGSPIGSDDGEHFFPDGPDAEGYMRHFRALQGPPVVDHLDVSMSDDERDIIDVESSVMDEDEVKDAGYRSDETEPILTRKHDDADVTMERQEQQVRPEVVQNDPLLQAFPINLVLNKKSQTGKKHKHKLYFSDRLRQTHNSEEIVSDDDARSTKSNPDNTHYRTYPEGGTLSRTIPEQTLEREIRKDEILEHGKRVEGEIKREREEKEDAERSASAPRPLSAASQAEDDVQTERRPEVIENKGSSLGASGCRRLYASPYKCSECGLGLPSQHLLLQHSLMCRKGGVEPARPIQALALNGEEREEDRMRRGRGAGEVRRGAEPWAPGDHPGYSPSLYNPENTPKTEGKLVDFSSKGQTELKRQSDATNLPPINVPFIYKRQVVEENENSVRSMEEIPRDYSVKTLLRFTPGISGRWKVATEEKPRVENIDFGWNREGTTSPEEPSCSLPIKKRSLNQYGK